MSGAERRVCFRCVVGIYEPVAAGGAIGGLALLPRFSWGFVGFDGGEVMIFMNELEMAASSV
jgi:hypothetical protein